MNNQAILKEYNEVASMQSTKVTAMDDKLNQLGKMMPSELAAGVVAGGVLALLLSNKSAHKVSGTAATLGGAALLGGLAYKAYKNWQHSTDVVTTVNQDSFSSDAILSGEYQITLIKAMIAAARADGYINDIQRQHMFRAIDKMDLRSAEKLLVLDLLRQPIKVDELVEGAKTLEQKTELYLVSCMVADPGQHVEKVYLGHLAERLDLPTELAEQLQVQARQTMASA